MPSSSSHIALALLLIAFAFYAMKQNNIKADLLVALGGEDEDVLDVFGNKTAGEYIFSLFLLATVLRDFSEVCTPVRTEELKVERSRERLRYSYTIL